MGTPRNGIAPAAGLLALLLVACGGGLSPETVPGGGATGSEVERGVSRDALAALVDTMLGGPRDARRWARDSLARLEDSRITPLLVERLDSPSREVRLEAGRALARFPLSGGLESLAGALDDPDPLTRWSVVSALAYIDSSAADSALIRAAGDADPAVRRAAILGIGARPDSAHIDCLADAAHDPAEEVRAAAATALGAMGSPGDSLVLAIAERDSGLAQAAAIRVLGTRRIERAAPLVGVTLLDGSRATRVAAAEALGKICGEESAVLLAAASADDPQSLVREAAIRSLAACDPVAAVGLIRRRRGVEHDVFVRMAWVDALDQIHTPASRALLRILAEEDPSPDVRRLAGSLVE